MRAGIFFDRDGTINEEVNYLSNPEQLRLLPRAVQAIREANDLGFKVFIISNQSGVARGIITEEQVQAVNTALVQLLNKNGCTIDGVFYCPHHPNIGIAPYIRNCDCRKPNIGMLLQAVNQFNVDLKHSFVIGDKMSDIQTANNAGTSGILVKTGYGSQEMNLLQENNVTTAYIAEDCYDAVQYIKQNFRSISSLT